jgi:integrase
MGDKRAYGSGSIKEVSEGVWLLRYRSGRDPISGKYVAKQETFRGTGKQAQKRLAELIANAQPASTSATVGALRTRWRKSAQVTGDTMERYDFALKHVPDGFWTIKLGDLKPSTIADLYQAMEDAGTRPPTIRKAYTALSSMLTFAVRDDLITQNPCRSVRPPEIEEREYVTPTAAHLRKMIEWADAQPGSFGIWQRMAIATGVRKGELLALQWRDVDMFNGVIRVDNSMRRKGKRAKAKTKASERDVVLDALTADALRDWYTKCNARASSVGTFVPEDGYVFSEDPACRTTITLNSATQRQRRLSKRVGCPGARVHDLRHAHATMLLEAGVSARTVADRLGHSRPSTTTDIYGHIIDEAKRRAADTFAALLQAQPSDKS